MNITAIFTIEQIMKILPIIKNHQHILSIFAGRIFDTGLNAFKIMKEINLARKIVNVKLVASPRMSYDYISAIECDTDIITMQAEQIKKLSKFGKKLEQYSRETVQQFFDDAQSSGYEIK